MDTKPYAFHYNDGSFIVYDLTEEDYKTLWNAIVLEHLAPLSIGLFKTQDIRAVVIQKPVETETKSAEPELTPEELQWFEENKATWENFGKEEDV